MVFDFSAIRVPRQKHYSDSTLMTWNKKELIEYIRMLEHNYDVSIQFNENQAQYIESFCPFFKADRKTENNLEIPNNCDTCRFELYCPEMCEGCCEWDSHYEPRDEPQTDCGDFANRLAYERGVKHAWEVAQKVLGSTVTFYEAEDVAKQIDKDINVRSKEK